MWVFATADRSDVLLFTPLTRAAERHLSEFNLQDLASTAWAFATADWFDALLFSPLARVV